MMFHHWIEDLARCVENSIYQMSLYTRSFIAASLWGMLDRTEMILCESWYGFDRYEEDEEWPWEF